MSFRRKGKASHEEDAKWKEWLEQYNADIAATGIPPGVTHSSKDWNYFLEHGYWCEDYYGKHVGNVDFDFSELSPGQLDALHALLETSLNDDEKQCGAPVWTTLEYRNSQSEN